MEVHRTICSMKIHRELWTMEVVEYPSMTMNPPFLRVKYKE